MLPWGEHCRTLMTFSFCMIEWVRCGAWCGCQFIRYDCSLLCVCERYVRMYVQYNGVACVYTADGTQLTGCSVCSIWFTVYAVTCVCSYVCRA